MEWHVINMHENESGGRTKRIISRISGGRSSNVVPIFFDTALASSSMVEILLSLEPKASQSFLSCWPADPGEVESSVVPEALASVAVPLTVPSHLARDGLHASSERR